MVYRKPKFLWIALMVMLHGLKAQDLPAFELTDTWMQKIEDLAPAEPTVHPTKAKKLLVFSLFTGFEHWCIPHTQAVITILSEKSGIATCTTSTDIAEFEAENLKKYDAVVLNNNCSQRDRRDLFYDKLREDETLNESQRIQKAELLENNLLDFVSTGGGLIIVHGGITMQNKSPEFSAMAGGSFDFHPRQQEIDVKLVDPDHPMLAAFDSKGFSHTDEPYFFNNAYTNYDFHPLLYMEADRIEGLEKKSEHNISYIAWIKPYGEGRVFYSSLSHNAQSFENPKILRFLLDGMQYSLGDIVCDDSPLGRE